MASARALNPPASLNLLIALFLGLWLVVALFPLLWVAIMSFRIPVDAFAADPLQVLAGPLTLASRGGISALGLIAGAVMLLAIYQLAGKAITRTSRLMSAALPAPVAWVIATVVLGLVAIAAVVWLVPLVISALDASVAPIPIIGGLASPLIGATGEHYRAVWVEHSFYRNFLNSAIVTAGVVIVSLSVGTLAGYALARTKSSLAFWLLIAALVFRAVPQSVLVAGYLPIFIDSREWLAPLWNAPGLGSLLKLFAEYPPTLYGQPIAVIAVLVSINQPFTIWMLRSFFQSIPAELDEAARVDGCSHFEAFRRVIMPVMWPGVITTGLFSFLLAYNDYLVCAMLLDAQSQTMVPAIAQYFNRETTTTDQVQAVAAAVSITAPLFLLVMVFQRQIVSGLTAGAVKG